MLDDFDHVRFDEAHRLDVVTRGDVVEGLHEAALELVEALSQRKE